MLTRFANGSRCLLRNSRLIQPYRTSISPFNCKFYSTQPISHQSVSEVEEHPLPTTGRYDKIKDAATPETSEQLSLIQPLKARNARDASLAFKLPFSEPRNLADGLQPLDGTRQTAQQEPPNTVRTNRSLSRGNSRSMSYSQRARRTRVMTAAKTQSDVVAQGLSHALSREGYDGTPSVIFSASNKHRFWRSQSLASSEAPRARLRLVRQGLRSDRSKVPAIGLTKPRQRHHTIRMVDYPVLRGELNVLGQKFKNRGTSVEPHRPVTRDHFLSLGSWAKKPQEILVRVESEYSKLNLDPINLAWSAKFARISEGHRFHIWMSPNIEQLVGTYASLVSGRKKMHLAWMHLPETIRTRLWQDVMLWCLQNSPKRALNLLMSTFKGHRLRPARNVAEDCLKFLTKHYLRDASKAEPWAFHALWRLTSKFVQGGKGAEDRTSSLPQLIIFHILRHCDDISAPRFYWMLILNRAFMHVNSMLQFLERFIEMGKIGLSLRILGMIARSGSDLSRNQIQSACVRLLRARWQLEDPYPIQAKITTQLLEMGIRPNTQMFNCILLNTVESHNIDLALQMFEEAEQAEFATDSITHAIVLKGSRMSGNYRILEYFRQRIELQPNLLQDLSFTSNLLHTIGILSPLDEFSSKLDFYRQHFDLRPLEDLGLCVVEAGSPTGKQGEPAWPTSHIIGQMIIAFSKSSESSADLINVYNRFRELVQEEHVLVGPLARDENVPNAFLMAMGRNHETLQHCTTVIKHMLDVPSSSNHPPYAPPSVRTWTILASSYFHKRQRRAGEKVISMMEERGLKPDKVTWNTIIDGYALSQDVEATVDSVKRMEASGYEVDSMTIKNLGRLWNRTRLLDALKERIESQQLPAIPGKAAPDELVDPEEVESMARGWEVRPSDRETEVNSYLTSFYEERIGTEEDGHECTRAPSRRLERSSMPSIDTGRYKKSDMI